MGTVVEGGADAFRAVVYQGRQFQSQPIFNTASAPSMLHEAARSFFTLGGDIYKTIDASEAMRMYRAVGRKISNTFISDGIVQVPDIGGLQHASLKMQRFIMAEPTTRTLFHKNSCDGYSDTYVDLDPGLVGREHYDYRRATDGVYMASDAGVLTATTWSEKYRDGDKPLSAEEKADVQLTWALQRKLILMGKEDPTDKYNGSL